MKLSYLAHRFYSFPVGREINTELLRSINGFEQWMGFSDKVPSGFFTEGNLPVIHQVKLLNASLENYYPNAFVTIYSQGVISIRFVREGEGELGEIEQISDEYVKSEVLKNEAVIIARTVFEKIKQYITLPSLNEIFEEYILYEIHNQMILSGGEFIDQNKKELARILINEKGDLSDYRINRTLINSTSYLKSDFIIINYHSAISLDFNRPKINLISDELFAIEFVNSIHRLFQQLDNDLNTEIERAKDGKINHDSLSLTLINCLDNLESYSNSFRIFGEQYLAEVFKLTKIAFELNDWENDVNEKIEVLKSIVASKQQKFEHRQSWILEFIIVILILFEIITTFIK